MEATPPAITETDATAWLPCHHCGHRRDTHLDDGKCLFEASVYEPVSFDLAHMAVWSYTMEEPAKPKRPYPEPTKYDRRKERNRKMKAPRRR